MSVVGASCDHHGGASDEGLDPWIVIRHRPTQRIHIMSWSPCPDPKLGDRATAEAIELLVVPRAVDLGEMEVRRALPSTTPSVLF